MTRSTVAPSPTSMPILPLTAADPATGAAFRRRAARVAVALGLALGTVAIATVSPASARILSKATLQCSPGLGQVRGLVGTNDRVLVQWFWYDYAGKGWKSYYDPQGWQPAGPPASQGYRVWWAAYVHTWDPEVASGPQAISPAHQSHWATTSSGSFMCSAY